MVENGDVALEGVDDQVGEGLAVRRVAGVVLPLAGLKHNNNVHRCTTRQIAH